MAKGRSYSKVRTPALVRDYLSGEAFPGAEGEEETIQPGRGDYLASIHRHLKRRIKELDPRYHWPRYHSLVTLMRHLMKLKLVEHTGETETSDVLVLQGDPPDGLSPGDLRLDPARGFQQRYYWRLTPGSEGDPAWDNPMASIRAIYGIELVARPRVPRPVPPEEEPERPVRRPRGPRRPRRPAAAEEVPAPVSEELQELHRQLELRRLALQTQARFAAQSGADVELFETLEQDIGDFIEQVRPYYRRNPLSTVILDLGTLVGCTQAFTRAQTNQQRDAAMGACRRGSAVLAVDLGLPFPAPDLAPPGGIVALPAPIAVEPEPEEKEEEEEAGLTPETIADLTARWSTLTDRITGYRRPNSTAAANLLDSFVQEMVEAHPEIEENDLDEAISEVRTLLEAYQEIERSEYESSEDYQEARADAWQEFVDGLGEVDFSDFGRV